MKTTSEYVSVKPDLQLPRKVSGASTYGDGSYNVDFEAAWNDEILQYEINSIRVYRKSSAVPPVDGTTLRAVRVQQAFEALMHEAQKSDTPILLSDGTPYEFPYEWDLQVVEKKNREGIEIVITPKEGPMPMKKADADLERLKHAARLYTIGMAYGVRGLTLVGEVLGLTQRSAARTIEKARAQGWLDAKASRDEA